ncbi:MAG: thiamine-monophosphate kinase [Planctomycetota bacterium]|nr:MAG: thiamine-monophosphate kinase [Planctomycetota bacterium]
MKKKEPVVSGERELYAQLRRRLRLPAHTATPFGDDMASISRDSTLLWSTDLLSDGVDFHIAEHGWRAAGRKALAVNLSDCAAMAASPVAALCAVCLPGDASVAEALELLDGADELGRAFRCPLVGGDTNRWPHPLVVAVTVAAAPGPTGQPVLRSTAKAGDRLCLSGPLGGSILGRHLTFTPRVREALRLVETVETHALIDISDGFALDLSRLCVESGVGATVEAAAFDHLIHEDARRLAKRTGRPPREHALFDGEDFELIAAVAPDADDSALKRAGMHPIGSFQEGDAIELRLADGRCEPIPPRGWEHLS